MTIVALFIVAVSGLTAYLNMPNKDEAISAAKYRPGTMPDVDRAVNQAKAVYKQYKELGWDFSKGPCLSNALLPDWVLDIAHNPREPIDNLPENQCSAYREGSAHHFVELDPKGNLIRAK